MRFIFSVITTFFVMSSYAQLSYIAHRGASYLAPENTQESIDLARELGSDGSECDILLTGDNQIILFHDKDGKRLLNKDLVISETSYSDLKDLPIMLKPSNHEEFKGSTIPLLKDVLNSMKHDQFVVIEIKTGKEIIPFLGDIIESYWKKGKIAFIAFDFEAILHAKEAFPDVPCYYLSGKLDELNAKFDQIEASNLEGVDLYHEIIDKSLVDRFKAINKEVWCWTVNTPEIASKMQESGVKYITTDRPAWLKQEMAKQ